MTAENSIHLTARDSFASQVQAAGVDFAQSVRGARIWRVLAWNDILARYRGSLIGPFWITLTQGAFILGIGLLYSELFKVDTRDYIPLLANGIIIWTMLAAIVTEGCDVFIQGATIIRQTALPLPSFLWRVVTRNLIIFAHHAVVLVVVAVVFGYLFKIQILWAILGLFLSIANVSWMAMVAGIVCTRFRDMPQVITSVFQILFFLTPVLWDPKQAPRAATFLEFNPFYHMLAVTRAPLIGHDPHFASYGVLLILALVGWGLAFMIFAAVRRRVVHYL